MSAVDTSPAAVEALAISTEEILSLTDGKPYVMGDRLRRLASLLRALSARLAEVEGSKKQLGEALVRARNGIAAAVPLVRHDPILGVGLPAQLVYLDRVLDRHAPTAREELRRAQEELNALDVLDDEVDRAAARGAR